MSSGTERRPAVPSSTLGAKLRAAEARADVPPSDLTEGVPGVLERARGVMLGLAVGDALGSTLEFEPRIASVADFHTEMTGGGLFGLEPGQWTDDTAQALMLAKSLVTCQSFQPHDVMTRFVAWWRKGQGSCTGTCFDIGITTRAALARYERTGDPFAGSTDENTAGNGSLMRLAPVALFALDNEAEAVRIAWEQSRLTHAHPACLDACEFFVRLLRSTVLGRGHPLELGRWSGHPDVNRAKAALWAGQDRRSIRSGGQVADTLEAALWAVAGSSSFEQALIMAVNLGGDADTVAAVTGALAGAKWGASAIPKRWLDPLAWRFKLDGVAFSLVRTSSEIYGS